jgi:hypothetical protein
MGRQIVAKGKAQPPPWVTTPSTLQSTGALKGRPVFALKGRENIAQGKAQAAALGHHRPHPSSANRSPERATLLSFARGNRLKYLATLNTLLTLQQDVEWQELHRPKGLQRSPVEDIQ